MSDCKTERSLPLTASSSKVNEFVTGGLRETCKLLIKNAGRAAAELTARRGGRLTRNKLRGSLKGSRWVGLEIHLEGLWADGGGGHRGRLALTGYGRRRPVVMKRAPKQPGGEGGRV